MELKIPCHLLYVSKLIHQSLQQPVLLADDSGTIHKEYTTMSTFNPCYENSQETICALFSYKKTNGMLPQLRTTEYGETFFAVPVQEKAFKGMVIVGPTIDTDPSDEVVDLLMNDLDIPKNKQEDFRDYYMTLPVVGKMGTVYASMQLHYMLYQTPLDSEEVITYNKTFDKTSTSTTYQIQLSRRRQGIRFHHDDMAEKKAFQFIKEGKKEAFIQNWRTMPASGEVGVLSKTSQLRNKKNLGITAVTLGTRAAMEGGLHHEIAYTLSDEAIQRLETFKSVKEVDDYVEETLAIFADHVQKNKQRTYSRPINRCLHYVFKHLYEQITLKQLADFTNLHPNYLSTLFKKEVGLPLRAYIQKAKVEEAKTLMRFTDDSITEISSLLNFYDQSYFTKVFKKFTGMTPHHFRNHYS